MHTKNSKNFTGILNKLNKQYHLNVVEVTTLTLETSLMLKEYVDKGDWVVIAADRIPIRSEIG